MKAGWLLLAGGGQERGPKPVGLAFARPADCLLDLREFIRPKPSRDKFPQGFAPGLLWSANFSGHAKNFSVTRKLSLQQGNLCVTNNQVSHETALSLEKMAGTAASESELTNSQPVEAGASRKESEMKAATFQVRSLAIEATGDFFRKKITPKIRLSGQWLERAGFRPGHRVEVCFEQPGILSLHFVEQGKGAAL